jgi:hypothetical protein
MRKLLLLSAAALMVAGPALADEVTTNAAGGAAAGATAGFFIGGPIGALVGGVVGAGTAASISAADRDYVLAHREASISYDGDVRIGMRVRDGAQLYAIPSDQQYSYVYVNNHPVLIDRHSNTVVWIGD